MDPPEDPSPTSQDSSGVSSFELLEAAASRESTEADTVEPVVETEQAQVDTVEAGAAPETEGARTDEYRVSEGSNSSLDNQFL